jgi:hypothetical protein
VGFGTGESTDDPDAGDWEDAAQQRVATFGAGNRKNTPREGSRVESGLIYSVTRFSVCLRRDLLPLAFTNYREVRSSNRKWGVFAAILHSTSESELKG